MLIDHLEICGVFSYFRYGLRSSHSTEHHLIVPVERIAKVLPGFGFIQAVALDTFKAFDMV